jgi:CTP synthase (UTP-ammonia lyase)
MKLLYQTLFSSTDLCGVVSTMYGQCQKLCWRCVQALFCQVPPHHVLTLHDVSNIWQVCLLAVRSSLCRCTSTHEPTCTSHWSTIKFAAQVPLVMAQQQAHETICQHLQITDVGPLNLVEWKDNLADRWDGLTEVGSLGTKPPCLHR